MNGKLKEILILLSPSREFRKKNKARFLAVFDARHGTAHVPAFRYTFVVRTVAAAFGMLVAVMGGVSVYADTANVPADSVLYPWKRMTESVKLAVAPVGEQAQLQATLAARRVAEINDLEEREPTSTAIAELQNDANASVNASIVAASQADLRDGALTDLCGKLLSTVATSSAIFEGDLNGHAGLIARFTDRCERASGESGGYGPFAGPPFSDISTTTAISTSTMIASTTATSTTVVTSTPSGPVFEHGRPRSGPSSNSVNEEGSHFNQGTTQGTTNLEDRIKNYLDRYFKPSGTSSSSDVSNATTTIGPVPSSAATPTSTDSGGGIFKRIFEWWHGGGNNGRDNGGSDQATSTPSTLDQGNQTDGSGNENSPQSDKNVFESNGTTTASFDSSFGHLLQSNGDH